MARPLSEIRKAIFKMTEADKVTLHDTYRQVRTFILSRKLNASYVELVAELLQAEEAGDHSHINQRGVGLGYHHLPEEQW